MQNKYSMFIDDIRDASKYYDFPIVTVRSYYDAVQYVKDHGIPSFVSFDHDLADDSVPEMTGYSFAKFLIEHIMDNNSTERFEFLVHSANPVGKQNIECYLNNAFKHL